MNEFLVVKFLHVVGFAYWLGADLGVFYTSYYVVDEKLSDEVRLASAKILFALDQAPRICMTMMLPLGLHLLWRMNILPYDAVVMALIWILCFAWLAMVIALHVARPSRAKAGLTRFDFWFRLILALDLIAMGLVALLTDMIAMPDWAALKIAIFGGLVGCGLIVRIRLKPFGPAFANLAAGRASDADNAAIRNSLNGTRPFVIAIWAGLLASTALGLHLF
ncbi:MAG: hypothetical protein QNJ07_12745 [Woeseiaceae bacterium]|nr:hypothetical protein [Woeseiaceae bacterium]